MVARLWLSRLMMIRIQRYGLFPSREAGRFVVPIFPYLLLGEHDVN